MVTNAQATTPKENPDPVPENYGTWIFVFTRGRFAITQQLGPACTWGYGTYTVVDDTVEWRFTDGGGIAPNQAYNRPGEDHFFRWNRYRDTMTLQALPGRQLAEQLLPPAVAADRQRTLAQVLRHAMPTARAGAAQVGPAPRRLFSIRPRPDVTQRARQIKRPGRRLPLPGKPASREYSGDDGACSLVERSA
jgi:hypothetical protein